MRAVAYFEKDLKVCEAIDDADGVATAKSNTAIAKSKYEDGSNNEELVKTSQELYELRVSELGKEHENTIQAGIDYANDLRKANRETEARELLTKLLVSSKQVFGPDHNITKDVESELKFLVLITAQWWVKMRLNVTEHAFNIRDVGVLNHI
jgi:hypothetical protein